MNPLGMISFKGISFTTLISFPSLSNNTVLEETAQWYDIRKWFDFNHNIISVRREILTRVHVSTFKSDLVPFRFTLYNQQ
jgi:cation diffusion facilitator CzcD-associated flavoprotein CzcO